MKNFTDKQKITGSTGYNRRLAQWLVQCSADTFVVNQTLVLRINICGENRHLRQARNRCASAQKTVTPKNSMTNEYEILQLEWDHRIVQDQSGNKKKLTRGMDYDKTWVKLGEGFAKRDNEITFFDEKKFSKLYNIIDFETFELIQSHNVTTNYFKDKNNVYVDSNMNKDLIILEDANPNDFEILILKMAILLQQISTIGMALKIPFRLADAVIFEGGIYQKVGNQVFFSFVNKLDCDADTFEIVDKREHHKTVFKDKNHIYHKEKILEGTNPKTFHFIENCINDELRPYYYNCDIHYYAKDDQYAYFVDSVNSIKIIKTKDVDGFDFKVVDSRGIAFDKNYEYHRGIRKRI